MTCFGAGVGGGVGREGFWIWRTGGFLTIIDFFVGGEAVAFDAGDECDDEDAKSTSRGRGAIGIAISTVLLYAGYPSHCLPDLTHFVHCGRVSSHLTLRFLQLLHPVLTFGLLALLALTVREFSSVPGILLFDQKLFPPPTCATVPDFHG